MAILNITPDSFYDASRVQDVRASVERAAQAAQEGADILDIGGESTRPGAEPVTDAEQIARVVPVIKAIREQPGALGAIPISVDTTSASVAEAAIDAGADAINDVSGTTHDPQMLDVAARGFASHDESSKKRGTRDSMGSGLILMHRLTEPSQDSYSDQYSRAPVYEDVVVHVRDFLHARAEAARQAGVEADQILLDPGLGFGKSVEQNLALVRATRELCSLGYPVLSAASRKSFVGRCSLTESATSTPADRLAGSLAFSVAHWALGASIFRVHDVAEQARALRAAWAIDPRAAPMRTTPEGGHA
jgi:dihydropteroate synthase